MNRKRYVIASVLFTLMLVVYEFSSGVMVARAVLPPHATERQVLMSLVTPSYQMAEPHHSLLRKLANSISPVRTICAEPACDGTETKPGCQAGCGFCGHCPYCVTGPCTIYMCQYTGASNAACSAAYGTYPCAACEDDKNIRCT
jgi:hypothetical protein